MMARENVVAVVPERSAEMIAVEINVEKKNTALTVMQAYIKIGGLLCEVKEQIPYGEFGQWLEDNVQYSISTANNMMRVYHEWVEYQQLDMFNQESFEELFQGMSPTHVLALLPVPREERAAFIEESGARDASVREIKAAVKAREDAERAAKEASDRAEAADKARLAAEEKQRETAELLESTELQLKLLQSVGISDDERAEIEKKAKAAAEAEAKKKIDAAKAKAKGELEKAKKEGEEAVERVTKERDAAIERAREEAKREAEANAAAALRAAQDKLKASAVAGNQFLAVFRVHMGTLQTAYANMQAVIDEAEQTDPDVAAQLRRVLAAIGEQLGVAAGTPVPTEG